MDEIFKVLGDTNRLRIINLLLSTKLCVCELEVILDMTQSNVSRHLGRLRNIGLVNTTKEAQWVFYQVDGDFTKDHDLLISYLISSFKRDDFYQKDWERYLRYRNSNLDCQAITDDKDRVLKAICCNGHRL